MPYNITFDELLSGLLSTKCNELSASSKHFAEEPGLLDTRLFLILSDLCKTADGRKILQTFFSLSEKSIGIFSRINRSNVRNFIGIVSVSFQSATRHSDLIEELHNFNYNQNIYDLNPQTPTREEFLFRRFCTQFWLGAIRQIASSEAIARLVFGLSEELVKVLKEKSTEDILDFANSKIQRFSLRLNERFFECIPSISDAASNTNVAMVKIAYAVQSLACFDCAPHLLSSTSSYSFFDVISRGKSVEICSEKIPAKFQKNIRNSNGVANKMQCRRDKEVFKNTPFLAKVKQAFGVVIMQKGLTKSQVSSVLGYEIWQARQDSKDILFAVDSRKRSKQKATSEHSVQRLIFYCFYVTFAGRIGLEDTDLRAFFTACEFMNSAALKSRFQSHRITTADRFDDVKLLTQGLICLQRCPTCNFVNFYENKAGEFIEEEDVVKPCHFCSIFAKDESLKLFSRFIKNSNEMSPDNPESYIERHASI